MGFHFRFKTLLKVRKIREDLALQEFSKAQKTLNDLSALKRLKDSKKSAVRKQLVQKIQRGVKPFELASYHAYLSHLDTEIDQLERLIIQAGRQLDIKREEYLKAKRDLKVMERLREIDEEKYQERQKKMEMRFIDEIAIARYGGRQ